MEQGNLEPQQRDTKTVVLQPGLREGLATIGRAMSITSFSDLFGPAARKIVAFSDYAGDMSGDLYHVAATYVTAWDHLGDLLADLATLKVGIPERTLNYKGRKDALKRDRYPSWLGAFRSRPGLCVAVCVEKAGDRVPLQRTSFNEQARAGGLDVSFLVAQRIARAVAFFPVISHLLQSGDLFGWFGDHDSVLDHKHVGITGRALHAIANECQTAPLAGLNYGEPVIPEMEEILTLPDLVAGALAGSVRAASAGKLEPPDEDAARILKAVTTFASAFDPRSTGTRLVVIGVDFVDGGFAVKTLSLTASPPGAAA